MAVAKAFRKLYKNAKGVYFHISDFYFQKGKDFKKQLNNLKKIEFFQISKNKLILQLENLCVKLLGNKYKTKYDKLSKSKEIMAEKDSDKNKDQVTQLILMELIKKQISSRRIKTSLIKNINKPTAFKVAGF